MEQQTNTTLGALKGSLTDTMPLSFEDFIAKKMEPYYKYSQIKMPTGNMTNDDYDKLEARHKKYMQTSYRAHKDYLESIVLSYDDKEVEMHQTYVLVNKTTGEILNESHHVLDYDYIDKKKKELSSINYYKGKLRKNSPKRGVKGNNYKSSHRHTKVFSKVNTGLTLKNQGIFSLLIKDLSIFENIVAKQGNDKSFTPISTKDIQDSFGLTKDDLKKFKVEAKELGIIADVKLKGRQVGIRINPAYAMNGHQFSYDLYDAFKNSDEFTQFIKDEESEGWL